MSFELPYETLTPILGDTASYDPKTETTPDFMNKKFKELLENDKASAEQINVLNEKTVKSYILEQSIDLNEFKELNRELITANNTVSQNCLNTPIDGISSFNVRNYSLTDTSYLFQELRSFNRHVYFRTYDSYNDVWYDWNEYATVDMIKSLETRITDLENALGGIS